MAHPHQGLKQNSIHWRLHVFQSVAYPPEAEQISQKMSAAQPHPTGANLYRGISGMLAKLTTGVRGGTVFHDS
jgi:phage-related protein